MQLGESRKAIEFYKQALEIDRRIGNVWNEGATLGNMGSAYMQLGEYNKAIKLFEQVLEMERRIGNLQDEGSILVKMGHFTPTWASTTKPLSSTGRPLR